MDRPRQVLHTKVSPSSLFLSRSETEQMTGETEFLAAGKPMQGNAKCKASQCNAKASYEGGKLR